MSQIINSLQIEERAGLWLARRASADWSQNDEAAFQAWLEQSTAHKVAFVRLEAAWEQARRLKALRTSAVGPEEAQGSEPFPEVAPENPVAQAMSGATSRYLDRRPLHAVAAGIALAAIGLMLWQAWPAHPEYRTPVGGLASVPLEDGSSITLNTDSLIQVAVSRAERRVNLQQGEAFFEVAKDPARPFVVVVGTMRVIAVGTAFSVRRDGDGVRVEVTEGRVRLEEQSEKSGARSPAAGGVVTIDAGNVARATDAGVLIQEKAIEEIDGDLIWRTGYLSFRDIPLAEAIDEFNRYNERKIYIEDQSVAAIRLSGKFRSTQSEAFVRLLEAGFPVRAERAADRIVLVDSRRSTNAGEGPRD